MEELRPSILNNFGLFAALKWQLRQASDGSDATLTENYPGVEPHFHPSALTATGINIQVENGGILKVFTDNGIPNIVGRLEVGAADAIASKKH